MPSSAVVSFLLATHWALPTLNYLISIVLNHPHKLQRGIKAVLGPFRLGGEAAQSGGGEGRGRVAVRRRENKQSKCFAFHQSPAVLSFMSPRLQMPQPQHPRPQPTTTTTTPQPIDFDISLFYVFVYFIYFFLNIVDEQREDERTGPSATFILSRGIILLPGGFNARDGVPRELRQLGRVEGLLMGERQRVK